MQKVTVITVLILCWAFNPMHAQQPGRLGGNMEMNFQSYSPDSAIGADTVRERVAIQSFANLIYNRGNLEVGARYEIYGPPLTGIDVDYEGHGIAHRYLTYRHDLIELTAGHFYEQFGSGLTLRSYREWALGYDNAIDGLRVRIKPGRGITLTGVAGRHRNYWRSSPGIIRGVDGQVHVNRLLPFLEESKTIIMVGGSFVSRFQEDRSLIYKIPENVGIYSARADVIRGGLRFSGEYASKINDPSAVNGFIYKPGEAFLAELMYTRRGMGITLTGKRMDNMSFKSDYNATGIPLEINYLPPLSPQHSWELANVYPYATQPNGEMGLLGSIYYMFPRNSTLGGKYGTRLTVDYSRIHDIHREAPTDTTTVGQPGTLGYTSDFFKTGDKLFFRELSIGLEKRINPKWKVDLKYMNTLYDPLIKGDAGHDLVRANIAIAAIYFTFMPGHSLKAELQSLTTDQGELHEKDYSAGDWAMVLLEYNHGGYFLNVRDLYNHRNPSAGIDALHYLSFAAGVTRGAHRLALSWGRQREGISCVGGVCRPEPAASGFGITLTSNF